MNVVFEIPRIPEWYNFGKDCIDKIANNLKL
jgi:hypothetical protein